MAVVADKAKNSLLCLTVYVYNLFYYYRILKHNGTSSTKISQFHKSHSPVTSVTWRYMPRKQNDTPTSTALIPKTHRPTRTFPTRDFSLGSLKLNAPEARGFVELILVYIQTIYPHA
jgi:hypothetical protein